jgi:hypothetical protein
MIFIIPKYYYKLYKYLKFDVNTNYFSSIYKIPSKLFRWNFFDKILFGFRNYSLKNNKNNKITK